MKKVASVGFVIAAILLLLQSNAQAENAFNLHDKVLSAGFGVGLGGLYGSSTLPPIFVAFETGLQDKITIGGIVAYAGSSEDFGFGKYKYTYIVIAARGDYHFLENNKMFDAYGGAGLGYTIVSSSVENTTPGTPFFNVSASGSYLFLDIHAGGRYKFNKNWAAMAEVGYGVGFFRVGISHYF